MKVSASLLHSIVCWLSATSAALIECLDLETILTTLLKLVHADEAVADAFLFLVCHIDKVCEYRQRVPGGDTDARSNSSILCAIHRNYVHVIHVDCNSMLTWWVVTTDTKLVQIYLSNTTQGELVLSATPLRSSFENDRRSFCHAQLELNVDLLDMESTSDSQKPYLARR